MRKVTGLLAAVLLSLAGGSGGAKPSGGYCLGHQCFTVRQEPDDFAVAEEECAQAGGHLMTVRSSVSHDILSILLGNSTGRFWIGLRMLAGCTDAAAGLRGYEWVTKSSESDFFNWSPAFDGGCSPHRCVAVAREGDFKWTQASCDERTGFLCEYTYTDPCERLEAADGETVTYATPLGFGGEDVLSLPPGTIATRMPSEEKYLCFAKRWLKAPWNCEIHEGGCEHKCAVDPTREPSCYCPRGQTVNPANGVTCQVAAGDPCHALGCQHGCYDAGGSPACMCDQGFRLAADGRTCVDFNDCKDARQCPGENFVCVNTAGGFQCVCAEGYAAAHGLCVDVNECASAPCEHLCTNTPGGFNCSCYEGYAVDPASPDKCKLHCGREECPAECDPNDALQCYCPVGYVAEERDSGVMCVDIDECESNYCDQGCENTYGGYVCSCNPGFTLEDGYRCERNAEGTDAPRTPGVSPTPDWPQPGPTKQPSAVTVGGLVGIIVCTVFFVVLVAFLAHRMLNRRGKMEGAGAERALEGEALGLHRVTSDTG